MMSTARKATARKRKWEESDSDYDSGSESYSDSDSDFVLDSCVDSGGGCRKGREERRPSKRKRGWTPEATREFDDVVKEVGIDKVTKRMLVDRMGDKVTPCQVQYRLSKLRKGAAVGTKESGKPSEASPRDSLIASMEDVIRSHEKKAEEKAEERNRALVDEVKKLKEKLASKEDQFTRLVKDSLQQHSEVATANQNRDEAIRDRDEAIKKRDEEITRRDEEIKKRDEAIKERDDAIKEKKEVEERLKLDILHSNITAMKMSAMEDSLGNARMQTPLPKRPRESFSIEELEKSDYVYQKISNDALRTIGEEGHIRPGSGGLAKGKPPQIEIKSIFAIYPPSFVTNKYMACLDKTMSTAARLGSNFQRVEVAMPEFAKLRPVKVSSCQTGKDYNERLLYHGTTHNRVHSVQTMGLDPRYCIGGMFGYGKYFALHFSKSDCYTTPDAKGNRAVFLFQVNIGHFTTMNSDCKTARHAGSCSEGFFDSAIATTRKNGGCVDYPEVVAYEPGMSMPRYKIVYTHKKGCLCTHCDK